MKPFTPEISILMHQSIPAVPILPRANPRALAFFKKIARIPWGGDEERGQMPRPRDRRLPTLPQFFLLTSEQNGQLFSILMQWH